MQLPSPRSAEKMGKITVTLQRVMFKQALKEQIKEMRCTRLCASPTSSLTADGAKDPERKTYVIQ